MPGAAGPESEFYLQPSGTGAVVVAEFALTGNEVDPVTNYLRSQGVDVTAIHNHWLFENPRIFFVHAAEQSNSAEFLAQVMRHALNLTNSK